MAEHGKILPPPQFCQDVSWDPFGNWASPSWVFDKEFTPRPLLDPGERSDPKGACQPLGSSLWPGYARSRFFPSWVQVVTQPSLRLLKQLSNELSLVRSERGRWTVSLDVNQFAPEDITIKVKEDHLEITGKHDERQDEHGFVSRCFVRRYNIPANADPETITSYLSGDGVLSVEAPLLAPAEVIPVQVDKEKPEEMNTKMEDGTRREDSDPADPHTADTQASGQEPEHGDTPQQAPVVTPTESAAEVGGEAVQLSGGPSPLEQEGEIQLTEGVTQEPLEDRGLEDPQAPPVQQEDLGVGHSGPSGVQEQLDEPVGMLQREAEGEPTEAPLQSTEGEGEEEGELTPAHPQESQSSELEVPEKQDIEQPEEPSTKS